MMPVSPNPKFDGYTRFVEICGNCKSLITWDDEGIGHCSCGQPVLQFIKEEDARELGII